MTNTRKEKREKTLDTLVYNKAEKRGIFHIHCLFLLFRIFLISLTLICLVFSVLYVYSVLNPYDPFHYREGTCFTQSSKRADTSRDPKIFANVLFTVNFEDFTNRTAYVCGYLDDDWTLSKCGSKKASFGSNFTCLYSVNPIITNTGGMTEPGLLFTTDTLSRQNQMFVYFTMATVILSSIGLGIHIISIIALSRSHEKMDFRHPWRYWLPHTSFHDSKKLGKPYRPSENLDEKAQSLGCFPNYELIFSFDCTYESEKAHRKANSIIRKNSFIFNLMQWTSNSDREEIVWVDIPQFKQSELIYFILTMLAIPFFIGIAIGFGYGFGGFPGFALAWAALCCVSPIYYILLSIQTNIVINGYMFTDQRLIRFSQFLQYASIEYLLYHEVNHASVCSINESLRISSDDKILDLYAYDSADAKRLVNFILNKKDQKKNSAQSQIQTLSSSSSHSSPNDRKNNSKENQNNNKKNKKNKKNKEKKKEDDYIEDTKKKEEKNQKTTLPQEYPNSFDYHQANEYEIGVTISEPVDYFDHNNSNDTNIYNDGFDY